MKITKTKLKQLIKEELSAILELADDPIIKRENSIHEACNSYRYGDEEAKGNLKMLAQKMKDLGVGNRVGKSVVAYTDREAILNRCDMAFNELKTIGAFMEGELADLKFRDSGDFKPGQLTAHQQGRKDAKAGKPANPPKDPMRARDYKVGYDSAKDD